MSRAGRLQRARQWVLLLSVGAAVGAGLALVGGPRSGSGGGPGPGSGPATGLFPITGGRSGSALLDRGELTWWCREVLEPQATAEHIGRAWWCAGRPGGIWRIEELDEVAACAAAGWAGYDRLVTGAGVHCAVGGTTRR